MFEKIAVGFDGSSQARRACHVASELAGRFHSTLTVLSVRPPSQSGTDSYLESLVPVSSGGEALPAVIDMIRGKAIASGAKEVHSAVLQGEVIPALLGWLHSHPQELFVVGTRGLSRSRRLLLGSVSSAMATEAPCPVLVVRQRGNPARA
jgi:nucleotide-binding universal stress UspA family protein